MQLHVKVKDDKTKKYYPITPTKTIKMLELFGPRITTTSHTKKKNYQKVEKNKKLEHSLFFLHF